MKTKIAIVLVGQVPLEDAPVLDCQERALLDEAEFDGGVPTPADLFGDLGPSWDTASLPHSGLVVVEVDLDDDEEDPPCAHVRKVRSANAAELAEIGRTGRPFGGGS
jgi:hypothetical protein